CAPGANSPVSRSKICSSISTPNEVAPAARKCSGSARKARPVSAVPERMGFIASHLKLSWDEVMQFRCLAARLSLDQPYAHLHFRVRLSRLGFPVHCGRVRASRSVERFELLQSGVKSRQGLHFSVDGSRFSCA